MIYYNKNLKFQVQGRELFETIRAGELVSWESIEEGERWAWRELSRCSLLVYSLVGFDDRENEKLAELGFDELVGQLVAHRSKGETERRAIDAHPEADTSRELASRFGFEFASSRVKSSN